MSGQPSPSPFPAEWGGKRVEEAEVRLPGDNQEIEYVRVHPATGAPSGWEVMHEGARWVGCLCVCVVVVVGVEA